MRSPVLPVRILAGAPRGSPTQTRKASLKPVGEGLAPSAGRTGPYEIKTASGYAVGAAPYGRPFWRFPPPPCRARRPRRAAPTAQLEPHPRLCVNCQGRLIGGPRKTGVQGVGGMEAGAAQPFLPIAPTPWCLFGFFLGIQKEARRRGGETPPVKQKPSSSSAERKISSPSTALQ